MRRDRPDDSRHIGIVTETYPPEVNGVALTLGRLVHGLRARGHLVSVVRPRRPAHDEPASALGDGTTLVAGVPVPGYAGLRVGLPAGALLHARWSAGRPDAVYVATPGPLGWSALRAARRSGLAVWSGFHTNFHCYARHYHAGWLRHLVHRGLRRFHNATDGTLGSERSLDDCLTLKDLHPASLDVIRRRRHEIAAVLVNPVQCFHPNAPPPSDAILMTSGVRRTHEAESAYAGWLAELREVCRAAGVPLVFDEVYTGFRLAPGGAQAYFGVRADMVVYGKTVAGGMPVGVVCGRKALMRRFDSDRPLRVAYVIGTFSAHPVVMGAMHEFLRWVTEPATAALYQAMNERCGRWVRETNGRLAGAGLPLRVVHLASIWTLLFTEPSRYNWLLQYYLRAEGVTLSWVGTGRCLSSMDFTDDDYAALQDKLLAAAHAMAADGWWLTAEEHPGRERAMRRGLVREVVGSVVRLPAPVTSFYAEIMRRKQDDHHASHSNTINQLFHIISSSVFIGCYALAFWDLTTAMWAGLAALFLRQVGHAILEPPCHDKEATLLGFNTRNKSLILGAYLLIPAVHLARSAAALGPLAAAVAEQWFLWTLAVVGGRVAYLVWAHGLRLALVWFVKLVTDPFTDIVAYSPRFLVRS